MTADPKRWQALAVLSVAYLSFSLPAGSYATMLLREIMKSDEAFSQEEGE